MEDDPSAAEGFAVLLFDFIGGEIEATSSAFLTPVIGRMTDGLQSFAPAVIALWLAFVALRLASGRGAALGDYFLATLWVAVIVALVSTADTFGTWVLGIFSALETDIAAIFGLESTSIYATLDAAFSRGMDAAALCFLNSQDAGRFEFGVALGWTLSGLIVAVATALMTGFSAFAIVMAKFGLALLFAMGPLFVLAAAFPITRRFFELWFAQVLGAVLVILFVGAALTFSTALFLGAVGRISFDGTMNPFVAAVILGVIALMLLGLSYRAGTYAAGLSGGMSTAVTSVGAAAGQALGMHGAVRRAINPTVARRDGNGHLVHAPRLRHMLAGNTMMSSNYRRRVWASAGAGWRKHGGSATRVP